MRIRPTTAEDTAGLQRIVEGTNLFPASMVPEMLSGFLSEDQTDELWLTCEDTGEPIGFCYAVHEQLAEGTWNMLAIAVLPEKQGKGSGKALVGQLEAHLRSKRQRVLIVDTSSGDAFSDAREFYRKSGYTEEARIRDFWAPGDDKIVFWKAL